ncbi:hypothetical protein C8R45DRAFT_1178508 [Mycena sanguinolenta]|nr:hypothetical protein C8R45DRAFT_1178508 [Mycena sanguinolenta]
MHTPIQWAYTKSGAAMPTCRAALGSPNEQADNKQICKIYSPPSPTSATPFASLDAAQSGEHIRAHAPQVRLSSILASSAVSDSWPFICHRYDPALLRMIYIGMSTRSAATGAHVRRFTSTNTLSTSTGTPSLVDISASYAQARVSRGKKATAFDGYFSNWLLPYVHYIPVRIDLSDLVEKLKWALAHEAEAEARRIHDLGIQFAQRVLMDEQNDCYWAAVLLEWARVQSYGRREGEAGAPIEDDGLLD